MGNICRSPMAHGVVRQRLLTHGLATTILLDSAGTHGYHVGAPPDHRAQIAARRRGFDISMLRARMVEPVDFEAFDLILAMDEGNVAALRDLAAAEHHHKIHLLMEYALGETGRAVPDPYYGGPLGFERVLDMVEEAADALIARFGGQVPGSRSR